jgi:hypothetical protein
MGRHPQQRESRLSRLIGRLSYANIAATLALFLALTGTATAAIVLPRDSVGAEQIQVDAVRSSEIQADAVRSSEILDESIVLADLAPGARTALDAPRVRVDEKDDLGSLPTCDVLRSCRSLLAVHLPAGRWLVYAKFDVIGGLASAGSTCGLVQDDTTFDERGDIGKGQGSSEQVSLTAVVTTPPEVDSTTVALRCMGSPALTPSATHGKLTALEVRDEAQAG